MKDSNKGQVIIYQTEDGQTKLEVQFKNETVWLSLDQMAELFQRDKSTISRHIKNVFEDGELNSEVDSPSLRDSTILVIARGRENPPSMR